MKKTTKRILVSVLTLVLAVVAIGTTTFAWFTLSNVANVGSVEGTVTAGEGLEIRLVSYQNNDPSEIKAKTDWKSNLSKSDVSTFLDSTRGLDFKFQGITTDSLLNPFMMMKQDAGVSNKIYLANETVANEHYLKFEIQFRSQTSGDVVLSKLDLSNSTTETFEPDGQEYLQFSGSQTEEKLFVETSAAYAARVAVGEKTFQHEGDIISKDVNVIKGNRVMGEKAEVEGQWSFITVSKGMRLYESLEGKEIVTDNPDNDINKIKVTEIGIIDALTKVTNDQGQNTVYEVSKELIIQSDEFEENFNYYITTLPILIWIEGWDADAYNAIYASKLVVDLEFTKK